MRNLWIQLVFVLMFSSCKQEPFFFNFNKIEHYHLKNKLLLDYEARDSLFGKILNDDYPISLNNKEFYNNLNQKFLVKTFSNSDVNAFKAIFNKRYFTDIYKTACVPDYRDILILKKENKTIGIVKICVRCQMHYILGQNQENKIFTKSGGIENSEIETLLKKYN